MENAPDKFSETIEAEEAAQLAAPSEKASSEEPACNAASPEEPARKKKRNQIDMLHGSIPRKLMRFALPLAATNMLQQLFNSADIAIVGQFASNEALSAVGVNAPLTNLIINLLAGVAVGTNVVVATLIGRGDKHGVSRAVHTSIVLALICGVFLAIAGPLIGETLLEWIRTPEDIFDMAKLYFVIYLAGSPFILLLNFTSAILRSKGDTRRPLIVLIIAGALNVGLNLLFVVGLGMDVDGVAIATVISNAMSSITLLVLLMRETDEVKVELRKLCFDIPLFKWIVKVGVPAGLQGLMFSIANVIIQSALNDLGSTVVAGSTAGLNMELFCYFLSAAFAQAVTSFVGQNYGAGNLDRTRSVIRWGLILGVVATGALSVVIVANASFFSGLFTSDPEVLELSNLRIYFVTSGEIINALLEVLSGGMRGYGKSLTPAVICIVGICVLRVAWVYTLFPVYGTYECLLMTYPLSWIVTTAALIVAMKVTLKRLKPLQIPAA